MSPIEYIEEGIRQGNWETVCEGYERLTGKSISLPATDDFENLFNQIKVIYETSLVLTNIDQKERKKKTSPKKGRKKKTKKATKNTITEDGEDLSLQLDDKKKTAVQKELGKTRLITNEPDPAEIERNRTRAEKSLNNKIAIKREPRRTFNVECNECEQEFDSSRPNREVGQKCDTCLKNTKSRFK